MTPLRRPLAALAAGLVLAGAVTAVSPAGGSPAAREDCEVSGWTAYAPLDEQYSGHGIDAYIELCAGDGPPAGWPPGAQPPDGHPEIQIIR